MTSNQRFHGFNDRFTRRTKQLYRLGFRYECAMLPKRNEYDELHGTAAMVRRGYTGHADVVTVQAIHFTHNRDWPVLLGTVLRMA